MASGIAMKDRVVHTRQGVWAKDGGRWIFEKSQCRADRRARRSRPTKRGPTMVTGM